LEVQSLPRVRTIVHAAMTLGAILAVLLTAAASFHR
jgi:uncharacterized membrane protein